MLKRLKMRKSLNRYDKFNKIFYNKVQKGFLKLAQRNKSKYMLVNSNLDIETNKKIILTKIKRLLK